ncbi:uncharacterized protein, partial [Amphiura filiformis]|uniref:uncharacterized protein n=1 Tax=Amphiura filiformis TaxID=82378 RepID=UPI003B20E0E4
SDAPPLVVFVHGGGWRRGDRQQWKYCLSSYDTNLMLFILFRFYNLYQNIGKSFARNGIACAVISYPLLQPTLWVTLFELFTSFCMSTLLLTILLTLVMLFFQLLLTWCLPLTNIYIINQIYIFIIQMNSLQRLHILPICLTLSQLAMYCFISLNISNYRNGPHPNGILLSVPTALSTFVIYFYITQPTFGTSLWMLSVILTGFLQTSIAINQMMFVYKSDNRCEDQVKSVAKSVQWLKSFGQKTGQFDTDKIVLSGHSAGAHLINLLVWDDIYLKDIQLDRSDIKGIISLSGVHNLHSLSFPLIRQIYLAPFGKDIKALEKLSPATLVSNCKSEKVPQFMIVSAEHDYDFFKKDATDYVEKLKTFGHVAKYEIIPNSTHLSLPWTFASDKRTTTLEEICFCFVKGL